MAFSSIARSMALARLLDGSTGRRGAIVGSAGVTVEA
jgi:hypothetical protein